MDYSSWDCKELDTTERLTLLLHRAEDAFEEGIWKLDYFYLAQHYGQARFPTESIFLQGKEDEFRDEFSAGTEECSQAAKGSTTEGCLEYRELPRSHLM